MRLVTLVVLGGLATAFPAAAAPIVLLPNRAELTVSTSLYEVGMQRNGRVRVDANPEIAVCAGAHPEILFDGDEQPHVLDPAPSSGARTEAVSPLGRGTALVVSGRGFDWTMSTYVGQPFLTARVLFTNTRKTPVRVRALAPWCVTGWRGNVALPEPADSAVYHFEGSGVTGQREGLPVGDTVRTDGALLVHRPGGHYMLLVGFVTSGDAAKGDVSVTRTKRRFSGVRTALRAVCVYDPPVVVPPGGQLLSEEFYIAVAESDAHTAVERFRHAVAALGAQPPAAPSGR